MNVRSTLADFRSDGAVVFITLMLGNDCCIFNITINKNPVAVFPLLAPACGSLLTRLISRAQSVCVMKAEALLARSEPGHERRLPLPACPARMVSTGIVPRRSRPHLLKQNRFSYAERLGDVHCVTEQIPKEVKQTSLK